MFTKLSEPATADIGSTHERLNAGLDALDADVTALYSSVLPRSRYTQMLIEVTPELIRPSTPGDYFSDEQVATWGIDSFTGTPEDPKTPYYRTFEAPVAKGHLYEFIVPMVPPSWNEPSRVRAYADLSSNAGTAVAYSTLDVLQPAKEEGPDYYPHWVLIHFLLDGHHKIEAASQNRRPIRLIAFLDEEISIASSEDLDTLTTARRGPRSRRHQ